MVYTEIPYIEDFSLLVRGLQEIMTRGQYLNKGSMVKITMLGISMGIVTETEDDSISWKTYLEANGIKVQRS